MSGEIHQAAGNTKMEIPGGIRTDVDVHTVVIVKTKPWNVAKHTKDSEWGQGEVDIREEREDLENHLCLRESTREKNIS